MTTEKAAKNILWSVTKTGDLYVFPWSLNLVTKLHSWTPKLVRLFVRKLDFEL